MQSMEEYLKSHADHTSRRRKAHFNQYIEFKHNCVEILGIPEQDVPTLWVAYHLNELLHSIENV